MNDREKGYYIGRERAYNHEQNYAELMRLKAQADEMRLELKEGKLGDAARRDLQEQLGTVIQAMQILRESLQALSTPDVLLVEKVPSDISVDITNPWAYWTNEYNFKCQELKDLLTERDSYDDKELTDNMKISLQKLEADIYKVEAELDQAMDNYLKLL